MRAPAGAPRARARGGRSGRSELRGELEHALATLGDAGRGLVGRLYPEWARASEGAPYRLPAAASSTTESVAHALVVQRSTVTVADRWFPAQERRTLISWSVFGGLIAMMATPIYGFAPFAALLFASFEPRMSDGAAYPPPDAYDRAIAASWIRVSAIVSRAAGWPGPRWNGRLDPRVVARGVPRSGHGNHPCAVSLARALHHALHDRWSAASEVPAGGAASSHEIELDPHERRLYGELARGLRARGFAIPASFAELLDAPPFPTPIGLEEGTRPVRRPGVAHGE